MSTEAARARQERYNKSPKGRERARRYRLGVKYLERKRVYRHSLKGRETAFRYQLTPTYLAAVSLRRELQSAASRKRENRQARDRNRERVLANAGRSEADNVRAMRLRKRMLADID